MPFTGNLTILNRPSYSHQKKALFLQQNCLQLGTWGALAPADCILTEVNSWLEEVKERNEHANVAVALRAFKTALMPTLIAIAAAGGPARATVAVFLVEVLRIYNLANHDPFVIQEVHTNLGQCNVPVVGNVAGCIQHATFGDLAYSPGLGNVRMNP